MTAASGVGSKEAGRPRDELHRWHGNVAQDGARVGVQAGYIAGGVQVHQGKSPEQKYLEGRKALERGMPRRAEQLIGEAVDGGHMSTEVAYRWVLSIVSGRSLDELQRAQLEALQHALKYVRNEPEDGWSRAALVVGRLLDHLVRNERADTIEGPEWTRVRTEFGALDQECKEELRRHLDNILVGAFRDGFAAREREEVESRRLDGDREERAWKFFAAEPAVPVPLPSSYGSRSFGTWLLFVLGVVITLAAGVFTAPVLAEDVARSMAGLTLAIGGGLVAVLAETRRRVKRELVRAENQRFDPPMEGNGGRWHPQHPFDRRVSYIVSGVFARHDPPDVEERRSWKEATEGVRLRLIKELSESFRDSEQYASSVKYLAEWHVEQIARRWAETGRLRRPPSHEKSSPRVYWALASGLLAACLGAILTWTELWRYGQVVNYTVLPVVALIGMDIACEQWFSLVQDRRLAEADWAYRHQRYQDECNAYRRRCDLLADRPTDQEMARWLDLDRRFLRAYTMELYGLANREIVGHLVLCEEAPGCKRAQDQGPMRYTAYLISVLLLTDWGVRLTKFHLDFSSGEYTERSRVAFNYERVASAQVTQVWVKTTGSHRQITPVDQENADPPSNEWPGWRRNAFRVSLVNDQPITVLLESTHEELDGLELDGVEPNDDEPEKNISEEDADWAELKELALDSSGVAGALHIMEAIAADGRQWLEAEAKRRERRLTDLGIDSFVADG